MSALGGIMLTNIDRVPGKEILEHYGLVSGSTIRAKHVGKDILASIKNIFGGELTGYTELMQESRVEATGDWLQRPREKAPMP